jgi:hypothetical protein
MRAVSFIRNVEGTYLRQTTQYDTTDAVSVSFILGWHVVRRNKIDFDDGILAKNGIDWIWNDGKDWHLNLDRLKQDVDSFKDVEWLRGMAIVEPQTRPHAGPFPAASLTFTIYQDEHVVDSKRRIFLSHTRPNKPLVRQYCLVLRQIGFHPWLDEEDLKAGDKLERGIRQGFEESCAALFFITPQFNDQSFLASEVDYAIEEHRKKGDRFKIIAIVFKGKDGSTGVVPPLLKPFVWKQPKSHLMALVEILRALPIEPGEPRWRSDIGPA